MKRKKISTGWKEYFNFSARERRGSLFLSAIIFLQIIFLFSIRYFPNDLPPPDEKIVKEFLEAQNTKQLNYGFRRTQQEIKKMDIRLFNFDPNKIDVKEWLSLGLSEKQANVIQNYLSKGGKFRVKKDLKKMYCISSDQYKSLEPFILLPDTTYIHNFQSLKQGRVHTRITDISTADSTALVSLNGIGPVLASRIVKYRDKLGGFVSANQLMEVFGITDTVFEKFKSEIAITDSIPYRFININADSFHVLSAHPYIKFKLAKLICNFRTQHGSFQSADEIKSLPLITEENFRKLAPYIRID